MERAEGEKKGRGREERWKREGGVGEGRGREGGGVKRREGGVEEGRGKREGEPATKAAHCPQQ